MNREKIVEAILKEYRRHAKINQEKMVRESLRYIVSDLSLIGFAMSIGIDTDAVLMEGAVS